MATSQVSLKNERKITWFTRIAYGSANLIGSGASNISNAWLLFFLTAFGHLPAWEASLIFAITSYLDVIANPIIGFISDGLYSTRIGRRFGRRRFFILMSMPLMIIYPAIWVSGMNFWYYLVLYVAFEMTYNIIMVPYETLAVEMTTDFSQRTYLTGSKALFGNIANFLTGALPGVFFLWLGKDSPYAFLALSITWAAIMLIVLILLYTNTWERAPEEVPDERTGNLWEGLKKLFIDAISTFRVRAFRYHMGIYLFGAQGALVVFTTVFTYFVIYGLGQPATAVSGLSSLNSILQIATTFAFIFICAKKGFMGPNQAALSAVILSVLAYGALYLFHLPSGMMYLALIIVTVLMGAAMGGTYYIPWTVYVFMADIDELVTNRRREGILAGAMTMCSKFFKATLLFVIGSLLSGSGFKEGLGAQPAGATNMIAGMLVIGTILFVFVTMYCTHKLSVFNQRTHKIALYEIDRIHKGGRLEDVSPENRKVVEELTGFKYEQCFGNNNVGYYKGNKAAD